MKIAEVEFRCPRDRRTMFGKFFGQPALEASLEYIEFSCAECKRVLSKRGLIVQRVLHRYRLDSSFVETEHVGQR